VEEAVLSQVYGVDEVYGPEKKRTHSLEL